MSALAAALLWAAVPSAAASPPPPSTASSIEAVRAEVEPELARARDALADIDLVARAVERGSAGAEAACRTSFAEEALPGLLRDGRIPALAFSVLPPLREGLTSFYRCRALAADDVSACAPLDVVDGAGGGAGMAAPYVCRRDFELWSFDRARLSRAPDLYRRCVDEESGHRPGDEGPFKPDAVGDACAVVREYAEGGLSPEQACRRLAPDFAQAVAPEECARRVRWFFGEDASLCPSLKGPYARGRCADLVALMSALRTGSPAECGASEPCRAAMSRGGRCEDGVERARAAFCSRFDLGYAWRLHAELSVSLERAALALERAKAEGERPAPELQTLVAALDELETRRQKFALELGQGRTPEKTAPTLPGARFASVDEDLGRAMTAALARGLGPAPAGCPGFSLGAAMDAAAKIGDSSAEPLDEYFGCQALVLGSAGVCGLLRDAPGAQGALRHDYKCRHQFLMWRHDLARLSGSPDMTAYCVAENYYRWRAPFDGGPFKPGLFREGCEAVSGYSVTREGLDAVCAKAMPYYRYSTDPEECADRLRYAHGEDPRLCETLRHPRVRMARCMDLIALRRALKAGGADCGSSFYCRLQLDRRPQSCAPYLERLRSVACAAGAAGSADRARDEAAAGREALARARRALAALDADANEELERRRGLADWLSRALEP